VKFEKTKGYARKDGPYSGEWILSLDDDSCPVLSGWDGLAELLREDVAYDAITCSVRSPVGQARVVAGVASVQPYLGLHQAGSLVRRELLDRLGGYDEDLFLWGVELDFAARAVLQGARLGKSDSAVVEHRCTPANRSSKRHAFYYTRNLLIFLKRYAPENLKHSLLSDFLTNVIVFSCLHRTLVYWKGARAAKVFAGQRGESLSEDAFRKMGPDLRTPFSFLG